MASCHRCGAQTTLYDSGFPVCLPCGNQSEKNDRSGVPSVEEFRRVDRELTSARRALRDANEEAARLEKTFQDLPPGCSDGTQALRQAAQIVFSARQHYNEALKSYLAVTHKDKS